MALESGAKLGPYEVLAPLGAGGMGEVYRACDTRLDREVAIKALPEHLAADADRLLRFQREAKLLASITHSNIAAIYGIEEAGGHRYLILEYVEGESLAARLTRGPLPVDDALALACQLADALEAAHEKGVIHRDLKPGNIMITPDGHVKVLDFGLARADNAEPSISTAPPSPGSPTATSPAVVHSPTIPGAIMGTAGYMSPEQARGKSVDKRTDIFSFGCVLFEMLSGAGPFPGETVTDSLGAIVHKEPGWSLLPASVPPHIRELLIVCLEKDRKDRLHDIADARLAIQRAGPDPSVTPARGRGRESIAWALAIVGISAAFVLIWARGGAHSHDSAALRPVFAQVMPEPGSRIISWGDEAGPVVVSPDGTTLAFAAQIKNQPQQLWIRRLDQPSAEPLLGTEGANFPFWAPDGRAVGCFVGGRLRIIDLTTRTIRTVCEARGGRGATWTTRGEILFAPEFQSPIMKISAAGGTPQAVTDVDKSKHTSHRWPRALPDGEHFLFTAVSHNAAHREENALYLGAIDGSAPIAVLRTQFNAEYVDGLLLFVREGTLMAVNMDPRTGKLSGEPAPLLTGVETDLTTWHAGFSASESGLLAYFRVERDSEAALRVPAGIPATGVATRIAQYARDGKPITFYFDGVLSDGVRLSPDGKKLATTVTSADTTSFDVWISDFLAVEEPVTSRNAVKTYQLTIGAGNKQSPVWSPDGLEIAYAARSTWVNEPQGIKVKSLTGGTERVLLEHQQGGDDVWPEDWSRDGKYLIYVRGSWITSGRNDIWALPLPAGKPFAVVASPADDQEAALSPDGHWLAYQCEESNGNADVYVVPFMPEWHDASAKPEPNSRWRVSESGGARPHWRADGKELYYLNSSGSIVSVQVAAQGAAIVFDSRTTLFHFNGNWIAAEYDVSPDGREFFAQEIDIPSARAISLVLNWQRLRGGPRP